MKTQELKDILRKLEYGSQALHAMITEEDMDDQDEYTDGQVYLKEKTGLDFQFTDTERDYSDYYWFFTVNGEVFRICGYYSSYGGCEFDDVMDFEKVKQVEQTVKVWVKDDN